MHVKVLDPLRGFAALSVVLFHYTGTVLPSIVPNALTSSFTWGKLGVQIFFVISGFVIPYALTRSGHTLAGLPRFMLRRYVRIAPPAYAAALLMVLFYGLAVLLKGAPPDMTWPGFDARAIAGNLLFIPEYLGSGYYNFVFWSLGIEFQYYLVIGLLLPWMLDAGKPWRTTIILLALLAARALPGYSFFNYTDQFVLGIVAFLFMEGRIDHRRFAVVVLASVAVSLWKEEAIRILFASATAVVILSARSFSWGPATWLGRISYSLYIVHVPVAALTEAVVKRVVPADSEGMKLLLLVFYLVVCIAFAATFHHLLEKPAVRWSGALGKHRRVEGRSPIGQPAG